MALPPLPTYYYYSAILCGGSIMVQFRSTNPNLADSCNYVKLFCDACGGTVQCFDNISPSPFSNTNDLIYCYESCELCNSQETPSVWYQITNCEDSSIEYSEEYPFGTFAINDGVSSPGNTWVVTGWIYTNPGGTLYAITLTGQFGCPSTPTPTKTPTQTPSPTPTPTPCPCNQFYLDISDTDTDDATGNTGSLSIYNGVVVWEYTDCTTGLSTEELLSPGAFYLCACGPSSSLTYWKNNVEYAAVASNVTYVGICGPPVSPTPTQTITPTKTQTPTMSLTPTKTPTPSVSATQTQTPTNTPTQTQTPSPTPIICGSGVTTGTYWYTDCCGNFQEGKTAGIVVNLDYTQVFAGITRLNEPATTVCLTPTQTQTPSPTTTLTITPTTSPTPTKTPVTTPTPTSTPTPTPVYRLQNNCDVFTLFDLGVNCNVIKMPSGPDSYDGILTLSVTGGTSPYSFYWTNGQRTKTLTNIGPGLYPVQIVDFYGDYTANTVCSLILPSPTASPTPTITPSRTPNPVYPNICFFAYNQYNQFGPTTFIQNGTANGRPKWTSSNSQNIVWKTTRWEIVGSDLVTPINPAGGGIFASYSTSLPPLGGWELLGGTQSYTINVTAGSCPSVTALQVSLEQQNSSCDEQTNCNGSITVNSRFGQPPYEYSINNGVSYQTSNIFTNLCPNTYNVRVRDSLNNVSNQEVQITSLGTLQTYQINVITQPQLTTEVITDSIATKTTYFYVTSVPPIPPGITISFNLTTSTIKTLNGPGSGTSVDNFTILQNGVPKVPISTNITSTTGTRPNCNPEPQRIDTETDQYFLELTDTYTVSGSTTSILTITDGQVGQQTNCTTNLQQTISVQISNVQTKGCACCSAVGDTLSTPVNSNSITYDGVVEVPTCVTCAGVIESGDIYLDMNTLVGGLICTGPNRTGCFQNFRYNAVGGTLNSSSGVSSYLCGMAPNNNIQYMQANFQTPTSDNYYVQALAYLNGVLVGSGKFNGFCSSTSNESVNVNMFSPININAGDIFLMSYSSSAASGNQPVD